MDVDDHRPAAGESGSGGVEEAADLEAVEALPIDRPRLDERVGHEPAELALRPADDRPPFDRIPHVDI